MSFGGKAIVVDNHGKPACPFYQDQKMDCGKTRDSKADWAPQDLFKSFVLIPKKSNSLKVRNAATCYVMIMKIWI